MKVFSFKAISIFCVVCSLIVFSTQAMALTLGFNPTNSSTIVGDSFSIDLVISGLENSDLGYFEFDINYDDSILGFNSYSLGSGLGDISALEADDWSTGYIGGGTINLIELSYLWDLSFQADSFTLATLSFTSLAQGTSILAFSNILLGDDMGYALSADLESGSVDVAPVPEPATILLLGAGFAGLLGSRKKFKIN